MAFLNLGKLKDHINFPEKLIYFLDKSSLRSKSVKMRQVIDRID